MYGSNLCVPNRISVRFCVPSAYDTTILHKVSVQALDLDSLGLGLLYAFKSRVSHMRYYLTQISSPAWRLSALVLGRVRAVFQPVVCKLALTIFVFEDSRDFGPEVGGGGPIGRIRNTSEIQERQGGRHFGGCSSWAAHQGILNRLEFALPNGNLTFHCFVIRT